MKTDQPSGPDDAVIDRLLARTYRDTSPEFEARWVALKRELRGQPGRSSRRGWVAFWASGLGLAGAALAVALALYPSRPTARSVPELSPQLAELFALDAVLHRAAPLLDAENRTALLNLPASAPTTP